jgi:hypothetical protein
LIENTNLPDEYILNKIVSHSKKSADNRNAGRVFIFPTLQMNVVNFREDEETLYNLFKFYSNDENNLS